MSFNIKYRPKDFNEIIGNQDIIESLESLLKQKTPPHTYLFHGQTGCGKTTFARILANKLDCSKYDITEINASNNRGIDTARDIISQMQYKPLQGKNKTYILDEVHQATKDFQNGILKALEDSPDHVYFILCTTDPNKLLSTIRNRCTTFKVSKLTTKGIVRLLSNVLTKIEKKIDKEYLIEIAKEVEGNPRQALITLQKIIDVENEKQIKKIISSIKTEEKQIIDLCRALNEKKGWSIISDILKNIEAEPETIRRAVLGYFSAVCLNAKSDNIAVKASTILENFEDNYYDSGKAGLLLSCIRSIF